MTPIQQINQIQPGKNYPAFVEIREKNGAIVRFNLQSYEVGMYAAIYMNGVLMMQTGDHNNKEMVQVLKRDLKKALKRGAEVEVLGIKEIVSEMPS